MNKTIKNLLVIVSVLNASSLFAATPATAATPPTKKTKPRIIVTQDGERVDKDTMVRFLTYTCDFEVVGIVENNSRFQKRGHSKEKWIQKKIDAYASVLSNLRVHNPDYPDPEYLRSVIKLGNENPGDLWKAPPDMATKDTPGSDLMSPSGNGRKSLAFRRRL